MTPVWPAGALMFECTRNSGGHVRARAAACGRKFRAPCSELMQPKLSRQLKSSPKHWLCINHFECLTSHTQDGCVVSSLHCPPVPQCISDSES